MEMPKRHGSSDSYRFGFNGMEKDDEVKGNGNHLDFGARGYDPRLGRWLSTDPLEGKYPSYSPYNFAANSPLMFIDPDGKKIVFVIDKKNGTTKKDIREAKRALRKFMKGSKTAKTLVNDLKRSDNVHTIVVSRDVTTDDGKWVGSNAVADDPYVSEEQGSTIVFDLNQTNWDLEESHSKETNQSLVLGHELGHAWRVDNGLTEALPPKVNLEDYERGSPEYFSAPMNRIRETQNIKDNEEQAAVHIENAVRAEKGIPLRKFYHGPDYDDERLETTTPGYETKEDYINKYDLHNENNIDDK